MSTRVKLLAAAALGVAIFTLPNTADGSTTVHKPFQTLIADLPVAAASHYASYDRGGEFGDWTDHATKYGECDTRALVLIEESKLPTTRNRYCTVETGRWVSMYDGKVITHAYGGTEVQVDHVVPVENAYISGAWRWSAGTRKRFYNDLQDPRSLNAVSSSSNESKSAQPPNEWMPAKKQCLYLRDWVAVKTRWSLTVTQAEKIFIERRAATCSNPTMRVTKARIRLS